MLQTYYLPRWKRYFDALAANTPTPDDKAWYTMEAAWAEDNTLALPVKPQGQPVSTAARLFAKYFGSI